jgi:hypothetical protein
MGHHSPFQSTREACRSIESSILARSHSFAVLLPAASGPPAFEFHRAGFGAGHRRVCHIGSGDFRQISRRVSGLNAVARGRLRAAAVPELNRNDHAARCGGDRQARLAWRGQFADQKLSFDLEPDEQKEDCHQTIVDPVIQRILEGPFCKPDTERRMPEMMIRLGRG